MQGASEKIATVSEGRRLKNQISFCFLSSDEPAFTRSSRSNLRFFGLVDFNLPTQTGFAVVTE